MYSNTRSMKPEERQNDILSMLITSGMEDGIFRTISGMVDIRIAHEKE